MIKAIKKVKDSIVLVFSPTGNIIKGNYIGPSISLSDIACSSQDYGIYLSDAANNNIIGGLAAGADGERGRRGRCVAGARGSGPAGGEIAGPGRGRDEQESQEKGETARSHDGAQFCV